MDKGKLGRLNSLSNSTTKILLGSCQNYYKMLKYYVFKRLNYGKVLKTEISRKTDL